MTSLREVHVRCAVCGELSRVAELSSTSSFGPPDLDLRPIGPARWALEFGIQRCRACGYCAPSLGTAPLGAAAIVESHVYRGVRDSSRLPGLARDYFCGALIAEGAGRADEAAQSFLAAAWLCDDAGATNHARICRDRAAEMLERAIAFGEHEAPLEIIGVVLADVLRRTGRFDEALAACDEAEQALGDAELGDEATAAVLAFIRELAESGDEGCHNAAEAFLAED
jgi:tetratricopeptide (TPR) repeat protein